MTKKQEQVYNSYKDSLNKYGQRTELYQVYGRFSSKKQEALERCKDLQYKLKGYNGTIVNHNGYKFTYAFEFVNLDGVICCCYCTKATDYMFEI